MIEWYEFVAGLVMALSAIGAVARHYRVIAKKFPKLVKFWNEVQDVVAKVKNVFAEFVDEQGEPRDLSEFDREKLEQVVKVALEVVKEVLEAGKAAEELIADC